MQWTQELLFLHLHFLLVYVLSEEALENRKVLEKKLTKIAQPKDNFQHLL